MKSWCLQWPRRQWNGPAFSPNLYFSYCISCTLAPLVCVGSADLCALAGHIHLRLTSDLQFLPAGTLFPQVQILLSLLSFLRPPFKCDFFKDFPDPPYIIAIFPSLPLALPIYLNPVIFFSKELITNWQIIGLWSCLSWLNYMFHGSKEMVCFAFHHSVLYLQIPGQWLDCH